jgi:hypothetical protein
MGGNRQDGKIDTRGLMHAQLSSQVARRAVSDSTLDRPDDANRI